MSTVFREVLLPSPGAGDETVPLVRTFYVYHHTLNDLPSDEILLEGLSAYDTLVLESVEPSTAFNITDNTLLNGDPSQRLLAALEYDAKRNPRAKIISLLAQTGMKSVVVEPPADSKLWTLRRKRLLQLEAATSNVLEDGLGVKSLSAYTKARRLYIKDGMVPRDETATDGIMSLHEQSARILSFWGSAHMSIALALSREGIAQKVEIPEYQVLDIEPCAQIVDELRRGRDVETARFIPWLVVEMVNSALLEGVEVQSKGKGRVTQMGGEIIDRIVSMPHEEADDYLKLADDGVRKRRTLVIP
ncbi:MAG: hypothetical protein U0520_02745 [Candidatus Saccharimonadales bacterium]